MSYYSDAVVRDGAVAYWRLNETSGSVANDSIGSAHGTILSGVTLGQPGPMVDDKAMVFDGLGGGVQIGGIADLLNTITLEAWINPTNANAASLYFASTVPMRIRISGGQHQFDVPIAGTTRSLISGLVTNSWTYVVATFDGTLMRLYINGVLIGTSPSYPGAILAGQSPWWIGRYANAAFYFGGGMAEAALYPTALTATQIANHYAFSKLTQIIGSLAVGKVINLVQAQPYSLPPKVAYIRATSSVEVSLDGVTFTPLANAHTVGERTAARYLRTLNPTCSVILKYRF